MTAEAAVEPASLGKLEEFFKDIVEGTPAVIDLIGGRTLTRIEVWTDKFCGSCMTRVPDDLESVVKYITDPLGRDAFVVRRSNEEQACVVLNLRMVTGWRELPPGNYDGVSFSIFGRPADKKLILYGLRIADVIQADAERANMLLPRQPAVRSAMPCARLACLTPVNK